MRPQNERRRSGRAVLAILLLLAGIPLLAAAGALPLGTLTYRETEGDAATIHVIRIQPEEDGFRVELSSERPEGVLRQSFRVAADLSTREWTFSDPPRQMVLAASVQEGKISLSGSRQGKTVDKRFEAKGSPWNQLFQMGLAPFVLFGGRETAFRSIGTQGPGELKIGRMSVTRKGEETIEIAGRPVAAVHLRISLSGLLAMFWHGDYWYRKSDGLFLRYRGKNRKGGPSAVSELIAEEPAGGR